MIDWLPNIWNYILVALGIGGVIFIHESGHFLAARWCGVRVECFSLGFGPRLFGWKRGTTTYQLAMLPLGGYVRMAGEEGAAGRVPASDELPAKSVGQRFLIYSGGVIANVILGLVMFPILFAHGVPFPEPVIGAPAPGTPAWEAGIEAGSRIVSINGTPMISYLYIPTEVALGSPDHAVVDYVDPRGGEHTVTLKPTMDQAMGAYSIGVTQGTDREGRIFVAPGSAAEKAGLKSDDRLLSIEGAIPSLSLSEQFAMAATSSSTLRVHAERAGQPIEAEFGPAPFQGEKESALLGVQPLQTKIVAIRENPLAEHLGLAVKDRLVAIDGQRISNRFDVLRQLSAAAKAVGRVEVDFVRAGEPMHAEVTGVDVGAAMALWNAIGLDHDTASARIAVLPGSPAARAGIVDGDRIVKIEGAEMRSYDDVKSALSKRKVGETFLVNIERQTEEGPHFIEMPVTLGWQANSYGFALQSAQYIYTSSSPLAAVREGWSASWKFIQDGWLTLKRILTRQVNSDQIGGIITISVISNRFVQDGIVALLFFLGMLSMNLAFLNVLPIPVLDGGHLLFLLIEKVKGSPVSEKVLGYSQMVGVVVILSLMVYVTFNDVMRWIVPH